MYEVPFSPKLRWEHVHTQYALSGVQIIFRFPPTFIPMIPSSHAGITILQVSRVKIRYPTPIRSERGTPIS